MKVTIARNKLVPLQVILKNLGDYFKGDIEPTFAYYATKNLKSIDAELNLINETPGLAEPEAFKEYDQKRIAILTEVCEKDEQGNPITNERGEVSLSEEGRAAFGEKFEALKEEYKDLLAEIDEINARREEFMLGESEIDMYPVKLDTLPKLASEGKPGDWVSEVMDILDPIITA